jgi:hypothetical protein
MVLLHDRPFRTAAVRLAAALFFALLPALAQAQTIGCPAPTGGNCVPVVVATATGSTAGYPAGATPITASATGTTGAVTATLAAAAAKTTYLCTLQIGEAGTGTATATATNTITGTLNYVVSAPGNFTVTYQPCVPANAVNTTIPTATAANASATAVAVTATGYQL